MKEQLILLLRQLAVSSQSAKTFNAKGRKARTMF